MRRSIIALTALSSSLAFWACEDGPNQTFTPLPAGGGDLINTGNPDASAVDPSIEPLDANFPTKSRQEICDATLKHNRWGKMVQDPITPPRIYAGLDMAHSDQWEGLTIEEAEAAPTDLVNFEPGPGGGNCQSISNGFVAGDSGTDGSNFWGDNQEVVFNYDIGTHIVDQMQINLGYIGKWQFKDRTGTHGYIMQLQSTWQKCDGNYANCAAFIIPWTVKAGREKALTELYNAAMWTDGAAAGVPQSTYVDSQDCATDHGCLVIVDDGTGVNYFGVRPLAIYINGHAGQPDPIPSQPFSFYNFYIKNEPYGNLPNLLRKIEDK